MPNEANRKEEVQSQAREGAPNHHDHPAEAGKRFVKPELARHESLPRVTAGLAGGGSP
jgi:hypothetical protein